VRLFCRPTRPPFYCILLLYIFPLIEKTRPHSWLKPALTRKKPPKIEKNAIFEREGDFSLGGSPQPRGSQEPWWDRSRHGGLLNERNSSRAALGKILIFRWVRHEKPPKNAIFAVFFGGCQNHQTGLLQRRWIQPSSWWRKGFLSIFLLSVLCGFGFFLPILDSGFTVFSIFSSKKNLRFFGKKRVFVERGFPEPRSFFELHCDLLELLTREPRG